ncbi:unnamed protein product [Paramecium octaurelia]|uniref:Uncharacterized protein n=1 Tax=Paramecium octaurelia TaxID=43137 RepID=A0A8S1SHI5_PAROT|nr:unnamed protein product [Paramecium octaurelia]
MIHHYVQCIYILCGLNKGNRNQLNIINIFSVCQFIIALIQIGQYEIDLQVSFYQDYLTVSLTEQLQQQGFYESRYYMKQKIVHLNPIQEWGKNTYLIVKRFGLSCKVMKE